MRKWNAINAYNFNCIHRMCFKKSTPSQRISNIRSSPADYPWVLEGVYVITMCSQLSFYSADEPMFSLLSLPNHRLTSCSSLPMTELRTAHPNIIHQCALYFHFPQSGSRFYLLTLPGHSPNSDQRAIIVSARLLRLRGLLRYTGFRH